MQIPVMKVLAFLYKANSQWFWLPERFLKSIYSEEIAFYILYCYWT